MSSVDKRSAKPVKRLPPPVKTTFPMRTWRSSGSQARKASVIRAGIFLGKFGFVACIEEVSLVSDMNDDRVHTTSCGEWKKNCSPTENRSGPKYVLKPVGNSYCRGDLCAAAL